MEFSKDIILSKSGPRLERWRFVQRLEDGYAVAQIYKQGEQDFYQATVLAGPSMDELEDTDGHPIVVFEFELAKMVAETLFIEYLRERNGSAKQS